MITSSVDIGNGGKLFPIRLYKSAEPSGNGKNNYPS